MGEGTIVQTVVELTKTWKESRRLKLSNSKISQRMNLGIISIDVGENPDFSRVILQSIQICMRHIPTKDL